ncbi:DUF5668 domain-containing protein [Aquibacillus koreensis]|uniref:DUF5668 domain-containing protein n=1 Tax=Aquibacillus koreensis TaxID=279446 RepID=A0A9X4AID3_9BACI|nr:DUF5668 domain-containing protein [Aquibacillus koreensis]MCT2537926.1 DUF5668 domain-containing protein [Aquibacillus koreensis]MDC3419183.1 DUF5668 domain-containing protein [Aquibacillus koreensis]
MKRQYTFIGFVLIAIGAYFFIQQLRLPIFTNFYSWTTLLIILGLVFLIYSYITKDYKNLFPGAIMIGLGLHFHGLAYYSFWIDHWGMYPLILSFAFFITYHKTKSGLFPAILFLVIGLGVILLPEQLAWFSWMDPFRRIIEQFWPVLLIVIGGFILFKKGK